MVVNLSQELTNGENEVLEYIIKLGATQDKEIKINSTKIGKDIKKHRASVTNYINALYLNGKIVKRKSGSNIYVKLLNVKKENKKLRRLNRIKESINIADEIELTLSRPISGISSRIKGEVISLTEDMFVIKRRKYGRDLYKESFLYKDILIKDVQGVKVNGKLITY